MHSKRENQLRKVFKSWMNCQMIAELSNLKWK